MNNLNVPTAKGRRLALAVGTMAVISLVAAACGGGGGSAAASTSSSNKPVAAKTSATNSPSAPLATGLQAAASTGSKSGSSSGSGSSGGPPAAFRPAASGKIASVTGDILEVQSAESGQTTVNLSSKTVITATVSVSESDVVKGTCISATGTKGTGGIVDATTIALFAATKGECTRGFGAGGGGGGFRFPGGTVPRRTTGTRPRTCHPAGQLRFRFGQGDLEVRFEDKRRSRDRLVLERKGHHQDRAQDGGRLQVDQVHQVGASGSRDAQGGRVRHGHRLD